MLGGSGDEEASSIQQTADGGYILAGTSNSIDGDVTGIHDGYDTIPAVNGTNMIYHSIDAWIVKLDDSGKIKWEKCYGGSRDDGIGHIQQDPDGGYIMGGYCESFDGDGSKHMGKDGGYWVVKLDAMEIIQWENWYGGSGEDILNDIQQTSDGNYIVAGATLQ